MPLSPVSPGDFERVAEELARYWKERGMDVYDKEWALQYLVRGHALGVVSDRFFLYKNSERQDVGLIALVIYEGEVAEIRDEIVFSPHHRQQSLEQMLKAVIARAQIEGLRKIYSLSLYPYVGVYSLLGFRREGLLRDHFRKGEDLVMMSLFL